MLCSSVRTAKTKFGCSFFFGEKKLFNHETLMFAARAKIQNDKKDFGLPRVDLRAFSCVPH